ncbi:NADPH-dependent FMN reductase [soil metagenome]
MAQPKPNILALSGSLRKESYNTAILVSLGEAVADKATLTVFPLNDIPLYNQDLDTDTPPAAVTAFRDAIRETDGLVIASPEYNYGMSGVLKNALDWASRPYGKSAMTGKPVLTLSSSPAFTGGARAQGQLNEILIAMSSELVLRPQTVIAAAHQKITDGKLTDEQTLTFLSAGIDDLIRNIRHRASAIQQEA